LNINWNVDIKLKRCEGVLKIGMKCNTIGCKKEATRHSKVDIGFGLIADIWSCEKHHKEHVKSVNEAF